MAFTIPETLPESFKDATKGERKIFEYLKKNLADDYIVYYNVPVEGYYPDFIIIGPDLGVFVLEVKDWDFNSIKSITKESVTVSWNGEEKKFNNPIAQARGYVLKILKAAEKRSYLASKKDLLLKWGYGAIFPNIDCESLEMLSLAGVSFEEAIGSEFVFTKDDLKENILMEKIKDKMAKRNGPAQLKEKDIELLRTVIYPELLISETLSDKEILKIIDKKQEAYAKNLGMGHHIIRGVAGSGKTVILLARAKFLAAIYPQWKILVLCYNKSLANFFADRLKDFKNIEVRTYHSWCFKELKEAKVNVFANKGNDDSYWENVLPSKLIDVYKNDPARRGKYQAILIDEGQDFAGIWYQTILDALDKKTESLLIALDGSQTIYRRKVSWKKLNIQVIGRTKILKVNYRNTKQIIESAYKLIGEMDKKGDFVFEENPDYVIPEKVLREGPEPEFKKFDKFEDEKKYMLEWVKSKISENPQESIMILCLNNKDEAGIKDYFERNSIRVSLVSDKNINSNVLVSTIHSAKGLESDKVIIIDVNLLEKYQSAEAKRLLYIAMTRSREQLCVCYVGECKTINS